MISVIIPARNCAAGLRDCLASLRCQNLPPHEIIVVDDASSDATAAAAREAGATVVALQVQSGPGAARAAGVRAATGSILAFIDADCLAPSTWLQQASAALAGTTVAATGGYCGSAGPGLLGRLQYLELAYRQRNCRGAVATVSGANCVVTAAAYHAAGGFAAEYNEDMEFGIRLSRFGQIVWLPGNGVVHRFRGTAAGYLRQQAFFAAQVVDSVGRRQRRLRNRDQIDQAAVACELAATACLPAGAAVAAATVSALPLAAGAAAAVLGKLPVLFWLVGRNCTAVQLGFALPLLLARDFVWMAGLVHGMLRVLCRRR